MGKGSADLFRRIRYWKIGLVIIVILIPLFFGLFWLTLTILFLGILYRTLSNLIQKIKYNALRKPAKVFFIFFYVLIISIGLKLLIMDIYRIPSGSMEDTLFPEDVILVNKLIYGPKLPRSPFEISWVNLMFYLNEKARAKIDQDWWPYKRLEGERGIEQGDLMVYQLSRTFFVVKRCVAVAGDTLSLIDGEVFTNGKDYPSTITIKENYSIITDNRRELYKNLDSLGIRGSVYPDNQIPQGLKGTLSHDEKELLKILPGIKSIEKVLDTFAVDKGLFALPVNTRWNLDNMGPLVVPQKGMTIHLDPFTFDLYQKVIKEHEKVELTQLENNYYIDFKKVTDYTFKQDYYFVMGDNRKESMDSRYIGFIPEVNVIGKVNYILFSYYGGKFDWKRFLRSTDQ